MKCVCGYEHLEDWELENKLEDEPDFKNGDEEFIRSKQGFPFQINSYNWYDTDGQEMKSIFACPKCGTLKISL